MLRGKGGEKTLDESLQAEVAARLVAHTAFMLARSVDVSNRTSIHRVMLHNVRGVAHWNSS